MAGHPLSQQDVASPRGIRRVVGAWNRPVGTRTGGRIQPVGLHFDGSLRMLAGLVERMRLFVILRQTSFLNLAVIALPRNFGEIRRIDLQQHLIGEGCIMSA